MNIETIKNLRWPQDRERIPKVQELLLKKVRIEPLKRRPSTVAGVDAAFSGREIISVACLFEFPSLKPIKDAHVVREVRFPYIPGLLSFREGPGIIDAIKKLGEKPGLVIFDGQGIAHPKGLGIASFVGALLDIPSIGAAKSRLVGTHREPGKKRGSYAPLEYKGKVVGAALRTQDSVRPVFVSPGHRIDIDGSVDMVLKCTGRYRLTEPVRRADSLTRIFKKELLRADTRADAAEGTD